jgi:phage shock protein C
MQRSPTQHARRDLRSPAVATMSFVPLVPHPEAIAMSNPKRLARSRDKVFFGVCAGVAEFLDWPARTVRTIWAVAVLFTGGGALLAYIILAFAMPPPKTFNIDDFREQ